jgi:hypothetical protein
VCILPKVETVEATCSDAVVGELYIAVIIDENVACLDVTMNVAVAVEVAERLDHRLHDGGNHALFQPLRCGESHGAAKHFECVTLLRA